MAFDTSDPFKTRPGWIARRPRLIRLCMLHGLIGFGLSAVFTTAILTLDVARIGTLVANVDGGWLAALVFFVFNGIVFAGVQTGIAIMSLGETHEPPSGGGTPQPFQAAIPVEHRER